MSASSRPTSIRYVILGLTVVVAILLYLDRYCVGFVLPNIKESYRLTEAQTRLLVSAFFYTYAFAQIPCGLLSDRFGTRIMLSFYLGIWSALTGFMGLVEGFAMLMLFRLGCGLFEAGGYPACAGLIRRWVPYQQRGFASGVISLGGRLGGAITPPVTGYLMILFMPVSSSSLLTEADLLNPSRFAREVLLIGTDDRFSEAIRQAAPHLSARLTSDEHEVFSKIAQVADDAIRPADVAVMTRAVNEWLKDAKLADGINLEPILPKLNRQAVTLFERGKTPAGPEEIARRNRLLLQAIYPDTIRKLEDDCWQPVLMIYGAVGMSLALAFWSFFRDTPRQHFLCNEAEAQLVEAHETASPAPIAPMSAVALGILTSPGLWACSIVQFGTNFVWVFLGNELPTFLDRVYHVPIQTRSWMTFWPFCVALPVLLIGGWWTDWMTRKFGNYVGRSFPLISTRLVGAAAISSCCFVNDPWMIVIALCVFSFINDSGLPAIWAYSLDVGGPNAGLILGWGNMFGNLGAAVSAQALGYILALYVDVDRSPGEAQLKTAYDAVFLTCAAVLIAIGILSFFVDASKPIGVRKEAA